MSCFQTTSLSYWFSIFCFLYTLKSMNQSNNLKIKVSVHHAPDYLKICSPHHDLWGSVCWECCYFCVIIVNPILLGFYFCLVLITKMHSSTHIYSLFSPLSPASLGNWTFESVVYHSSKYLGLRMVITAPGKFRKGKKMQNTYSWYICFPDSYTDWHRTSKDNISGNGGAHFQY